MMDGMTIHEPHPDATIARSGMSINSALVDLHVPADPTSTERGNQVIAVLRRFVGRPRWSQQPPYLKLGDSYRIFDGRRGYAGPNWVHAHH